MNEIKLSRKHENYVWVFCEKNEVGEWINVSLITKLHCTAEYGVIPNLDEEIIIKPKGWNIINEATC